MRSSNALVWLHGEVKTPPFSRVARVEAGFLLRRLQNGDTIGMPRSRPMPDIGPNCHELRNDDKEVTWRIICHVASEAIVILDVFQKKSRATPAKVLEVSRNRLRRYRRVVEDVHREN